MATDPANPAASPPRRDVDREVVQAWLDALSTAACDEKEFLGAVEKLTQRSAEAGWDALALLDQYFRLGKIPGDVFGRLKSSLSSQLVGAGSTGQELSVPLPQRSESEPLPPPPAAPASSVPAPRGPQRPVIAAKRPIPAPVRAAAAPEPAPAAVQAPPPAPAP